MTADRLRLPTRRRPYDRRPCGPSSAS
jgi:hypothetical protein